MKFLWYPDQGQGKGYQLKLKDEADTPYQDLDYSGYPKNWTRAREQLFSLLAQWLVTGLIH